MFLAVCKFFFCMMDLVLFALRRGLLNWLITVNVSNIISFLLQKDMLCEQTVRSAVPLLLLLFRSVSKKKSTPLSQGELSQSFATFSSQVIDIDNVLID